MSLNDLIRQWEKLRDDAKAQRDRLLDSGQHAHAAEEVLGERGACYGQCAHQLKQFIDEKEEHDVSARNEENYRKVC